MGQLINTVQNEREGYDFALSEAKIHNNAQAIKDLEAISPYPGDTATLSLQKIGALRKWLTYYGCLVWGRRDFNWDAGASELSPDYTEKDLDAVDAGSAFSITHLLTTFMQVNLDQTTNFRCPVFLFVGRRDYTTSHTLAEMWFRRISAPQKELVWFDDASHMIMQEQPGRFLQHLVEDVRPLAVKSGDSTPVEQTEE